MTIQHINIGTSANDGTGEDLRTAFNKVNQNFQILLDIVQNIANTGGIYIPADVYGDLTLLSGAEDLMQAYGSTDLML